MKKTDRVFLLVAIGLALAGSCLLPSFPGAKRHIARHSQSVNRLDSVTFNISTNTLPSH